MIERIVKELVRWLVIVIAVCAGAVWLRLWEIA